MIETRGLLKTRVLGMVAMYTALEWLKLIEDMQL